MNVIFMIGFVIALGVVFYYVTELLAPYLSSVFKAPVKPFAYDYLIRVAIAIAIYGIIRMMPEFMFKFTLSTAAAFHLVSRIWALTSAFNPRKPGLLFRLKNKLTRKASKIDN